MIGSRLRTTQHAPSPAAPRASPATSTSAASTIESGARSRGSCETEALSETARAGRTATAVRSSRLADWNDARCARRRAGGRWDTEARADARRFTDVVSTTLGATLTGSLLERARPALDLTSVGRVESLVDAMARVLERVRVSLASAGGWSGVAEFSCVAGADVGNGAAGVLAAAV